MNDEGIYLSKYEGIYLSTTDYSLADVVVSYSSLKSKK